MRVEGSLQRLLYPGVPPIRENTGDCFYDWDPLDGTHDFKASPPRPGFASPCTTSSLPHSKLFPPIRCSGYQTMQKCFNCEKVGKDRLNGGVS
ncbi:hypothetical protein GGTG_13453 [Gaeumannomyces tritici R3-111a-1]|uniref:Uncharacterized protein n=1 Tax=Gaeumannomyces tritici (strain R3-111a-1) TaxID=644352 RepID=J3PIX3_GAET3|nr:hypothetical protein GGTG_13453 [Gaeumannomyces tritici R3-111a-1]EJT68947.1 hypothetical protein GGTG_13453 [Gaeumannomyces tritici R3-111a-1]